MKKKSVFKKLLAFVLALTIIVPTAAIVGTASADAGAAKEIYVSQTGNDASDGLTPETAVATLNRGMILLGKEGGTLVVMGEVPTRTTRGLGWPAKEWDPEMQRVTITGYNSDAVLAYTGTINAMGDLTIEHIRIRVDKNNLYLNARGHDVVFGKGLEMTLGEGIVIHIGVRGGGDTGVVIEGDTRLTFYSGTYSSISTGSRNASVKGNAYITFHDGTVTGSIVSGGEISNDCADNVLIEGDSLITIRGGSIAKVAGKGRAYEYVESKVVGNNVLDVSRYANADESWFADFTEVKEYDPNATDDVQVPEAKSEGAYINGYAEADGTFTFRPQNTITRAEAITIVSRLLANDADIKGKYTSELKDIAGHWAYDNIAYLDSLGVLSDLEERGGLILPGQAITRVEVCELIAAVGGFSGAKASYFTDLDEKDNRDAIYKLASEGIITGYANGDGTYSFKPNGTITRAEFVTIVNRFIGRHANDANVQTVAKFGDVAGHWAIGNIVSSASESSVDGKVIWTQSPKAQFVLPEDATTAQTYIKALNDQSSALGADAIIDGIEAISQKRIDEIRNTPTTVEVTGKIYYVSAEGNDTNDGLTPETAWKTLKKASSARAMLQKGDGVFFRRGDVFVGQLLLKTGVTYSAYGEGEKPRIYGAEKNSAVASMWQPTEVEGIWVYTETSTTDIGNIVFNGTSNARKIYRSSEADGTHLDYHTRQIFNTWKDLKEDLSFFYDKTSQKTYLRCEKGNPAALYNDIRLIPKRAALMGELHTNVTIDNLNIAYSNFGISFAKTEGITISNCEISWIGGCIQRDVGEFAEGISYPTPYGNGIEIFGEAKNFTVDNCYIWQCYDAGMTHQGSSEGDLDSHNVHYTNNVVEKCAYAIEVFYGESEMPSDDRKINGIYIENNILRMGGGFSYYARPDKYVTALIRNGKLVFNTQNYIVKNNILDRSVTRITNSSGSNLEDGGNKMQFYDNIFVQKKGEEFAERLGKKVYADYDLLPTMEAMGTDHNCTYILVDELGY